MELEATAFIKNVRSIETSAGDVTDIVELMDGHVLAITGELIILYEDMEEFEAESEDSNEQRYRICIPL